jgi:hypothetical protein
MFQKFPQELSDNTQEKKISIHSFYDCVPLYVCDILVAEQLSSKE